MYRVSRIGDILASDVTFNRPPDFNLAAFWQAWAAEFEADRTSAYRLLLRVHPNALAAVEDLVGPVEDIETDDDGWLRVTIQCEAERWARRAVLELGNNAEVVEPIDLRNDIAALAHSLLEVYANKPASACR